MESDYPRDKPASPRRVEVSCGVLPHVSRLVSDISIDAASVRTLHLRSPEMPETREVSSGGRSDGDKAF